MLVTGSGSAGLLSDIAEANSVSAFDAEDLQALGAGDISDIAAFTPNLEIVTSNSTTPTFFIRGIGLNDFNANAAGAVAIYQDDVNLNSGALQLGSLFDIGNVSVLRGPQGGRSFRNASAGAIRTTSRLPSGGYGANVSLDYGNFNLVDLQGGLDFPVAGDILSGRVAFRLKKRGGIIKNRCAGAPAFGNRPQRTSAGLPTTDPSVSFCGEEVPLRSVITLGGQTFVFSEGESEIDPFLPSKVNQQEQFAGRGILKFSPDLDSMESDWILVLRGGRVDQPSTLGNAIGTRGTTTFPDSPGTPTIEGLYGAGVNDQGYRDLDITNEINATAARLRAGDPSLSQNDALAIASRGVGQQVARELDPDPFTNAYSSQGDTRNETFGVSLSGDTTFDNGINAKLVVGYDRWKRLVDVDLDFTPNVAFETRTEDDGKQVYADFSLNKVFLEDSTSSWAGPIDLDIGTFSLIEELDAEVNVNFGLLANLGGAPRRRVYNQTVESFGGYAHASWDLFEVFTLDAGFRFNWERRGIDYFLDAGIDVLQNEEFSNSEPTGTVRMTFNPTESVSMYAKYTRGWKSGTFNATGSNQGGSAVSAAAPETIDAFEVGTQMTLFDERIGLYASFFHYNYQQYQLFTSQQRFQSLPEFVILNAEDVELFGSEVEVTFWPWEGGKADIKFAWLEGEFLEFVQNEINVEQVGFTTVTRVREIDNSGNRLLNAPRFTVNLSAQQSFPLGKLGSLTARWDGAWKDETFFDASGGTGIPNRLGVDFIPNPALGQGSYWIHNIRLSYATPDTNLIVSGWVRNVTDEVYRTFAADLSTFARQTLNFVGDPRTYGMTVALTF